MMSAICVKNPASTFAADGEGEKVLITGATGFLGQQIVGVLLEKLPKARLVVLLREKKGQSIRVPVFVYYTLRDGLISEIRVARSGQPVRP